MASKSEAISSLARKALLLQTVDISLGEDAALARDGMHFDSLVGLIAQLVWMESSAWR